MADGILYCLNRNLSMHFRVGFGSLATFKTGLYVTSVNNGFQSLLIFCHKELHLKCCIELELYIVRWSTKILKDIRRTSLPLPPWSNATLYFFALSFQHLIWTKESSYQPNDINCGFINRFLRTGYSIIMSSQNTQNLDLPPLLFVFIQL